MEMSTSIDVEQAVNERYGRAAQRREVELCYPVDAAADLARFNSYCAKIKEERPLVADESVDVVLSNCVLNLVRPEDKEQLFNEIFRVVKRGGRVAVSDIVCDEDVP